MNTFYQKFRLPVFAVALILHSLSAQAASRSEGELRSLAERFFSQKVAAGHAAKAPAHIVVSEVLARPALRVFEAKGRGFVVLSTDYASAPVLGYSASAFHQESLPCGLRWWLNSMDEALQTPARRGPARAGAYTAVENFLPAQWGQQTPFNLLCPPVGGSLPPSGCVATAMAQVLYFYRHPAQGRGRGWYSLGSSTSRYNKEINTTYDWDQMLDSYKGFNITDDQRTAVAALMRDAGYGCHMNYNTSGSGAYSSDCAASFIDNFAYDPAGLRDYHRDYFTTEEWMGMIQQELLAGRPILYGGADKSYGGHAFVLSGINEDGLVWVNWGWDGDSDGYYDIRSLNPTGILGRSSAFAFTVQQHMIIGIIPATVETAEVDPTLMVTSEPFSVKKFGSAYLQFNAGYVYNLSYRSFSGEVGFHVVSDDGDASKDLFIVAYDNADGDVIAPGYGHQVSSKLQSVSSLPQGTYRIYPAARGQGWGNIVPMRAPGGLYYCALTKTTEGTLELGENQLADAISELKAHSPAADELTRVYDANGRLVYSSPTPQFNLWDVPATGILIVKQGDRVRKVVR